MILKKKSPKNIRNYAIFNAFEEKATFVAM